MSDNPTFDDPQSRPQDPTTDAPDEVPQEARTEARTEARAEAPTEVPSDAFADPETDPELAGDAPFDQERQDIAENQPGGSTPIPNPDELPDEPDVTGTDPSDPLAPSEEQAENAATSLDQPSENVE